MYSYFEEQFKENFQIVKQFVEKEDKKVLLARHKENGHLFIMRSQQCNPEIYRKLLSIRSPYLPRILEVASSGDNTLILEEYIEGDSLFEMLEGALFSEKETRRIAMDICRALYVIHSLGLVHRDVKPENIILRGSQAVLLDFDASRVIAEGEIGSDTESLGTTGYAAPEQYGISRTDCRTDIYSLGITMNIMMTGEHPSVRLATGRNGRIISRCIMVNSGKRFKNIKDLMEVLD